MNSFDPFQEPTSVESEQEIQSQRAYSETLLDQLRQRRRTDASSWLNSLVQESILNNPELNSADPSPELDLQARMLRWLESMFDEFERYASEFNATAAGTNLFVSSMRPSWNPSAELEGGPTAGRCQGHLSTRLWCMYFKVLNETLEIYILPADMLLAFNTGLGDTGGYQPFLAIEGKLDDNGFFWDLGEVQIQKNRLPALARELFSDFIRIAAGKAEEQPPSEQPPFIQMAEALAQRTELSDEVLQQATFEPPVLDEQAPLLSSGLVQASETMCGAIDDELIRLSAAAGKAAQMSDLLTLARCKRLVLELSYLREQIGVHSANLQLIVGEEGNRAAA